MGLFSRFLGRSKEQIAELMKSLTLDFVADIYKIGLIKAAISDKLIDPIEPIILGMFLVGTAYKLKHGDSQKTREQIDYFYDSIENFLVNDIYLKSLYPKDIDAINVWIGSIKHVANSRHREYAESFFDDLKKRATLFRSIENYSKYAFSESVNEENKRTFNMVCSMIFATHLERCLKEL